MHHQTAIMNKSAFAMQCPLAVWKCRGATGGGVRSTTSWYPLSMPAGNTTWLHGELAERQSTLAERQSTLAESQRLTKKQLAENPSEQFAKQ
eukprot:COSAG06_NODE_671_length_13206_cov_477.269474_2_plen_92_part_00